MSRGMKRALIPHAYSDLKTWPAPDFQVFDDAEKSRYLLKRLAVEMYVSGDAYSDIRVKTGKSEEEVRRLIKRCLTLTDRGTIAGFYALISGVRVKKYMRKAAVEHDIGSGSAGCSGALTQLFERFPEIETGVQDLFFKDGRKSTVYEARASIRSIHDWFKHALRGKGLTDNHWPFNTANCGYKSLAAYLSTLHQENVGRSVLARSGKEAAQRSAVGNGFHPIMPNLRPFSFVQLDFHKVDAASIITVKNEFGGELVVPISRWHIGFLVEEKLGAILGAYVALEQNPSGDSTLEVVDSALRPEKLEPDDPRCQFLKDGRMLISHFFPELSYQCFSAIKVDNAWANAAHEVVNNIMDTVGCAVNFGPVRAWWRRNLIESIFGQLERRGLQRLPSTYGSGPTDTRKDNPNEKAIKFRISLTDLIAVLFGCIREHNLKKTEKLQWTSPVVALKAAMERPASGVFSQPVPLSVQADMRMLMHIEEVTVRGSVEKNERPYFTSDRCTYTNSVLANSYWLIGKKLVVYVDRRKCRNVYATVKDTGESLGKMLAESKWANSECSWRDRKLINRSGQAAVNASDVTDPLAGLLAQKTEKLSKRQKKDRYRSSRDGLEIARVVTKSNTQPAHEEISDAADTSDEALYSKHKQDPFGLSDIPSMSPIYRKG